MLHPSPQNPYYIPPPSAPRRFNGCAVAGFILSFLPVANVAGFVLSLFGFVQCGQHSERGRGLAMAGILLSSLTLALCALAVYHMGLSLLDELRYYLLEDYEAYQYGYTIFTI